jgi:nitrite reductase (NADH) small subunit
LEVSLGSIHAIPEGEGRAFDVGSVRVAVFRTRPGSVYAAQADCPHRGGPLADGLVGSCTVICPLHTMKFDLTTGRSSSGDYALKTYPTRLTDSGNIVVEMGESLANNDHAAEG